MPGIESARIAFAGTPEFAVPTLQMLAAAGAEIPLVLTQPDRPAGRGRKLTPSPVKLLAAELGLRVEQPVRLDDFSVLARWGAAPELLVVVAYGLLLPRWLLEWPARGCVNLHASLLPRWRGAAPIQHAILAGDPETGVSLMRMERGLDTGPVYARQATAIGAHETAASLYGRLSRLAAELARERLGDILDGRLSAEPQREQDARLAPKIAKADARIDWTRSAVEIERQIRAYDPWPVAETVLSDDRRLRVWRAEVVAAEAADAPGTARAAGGDGIDVATGSGVLRLLTIQPPGSRPMAASAYLAAHPLDGTAFVTPRA